MRILNSNLNNITDKISIVYQAFVRIKRRRKKTSNFVRMIIILKRYYGFPCSVRAAQIIAISKSSYSAFVFAILMSRRNHSGFSFLIARSKISRMQSRADEKKKKKTKCYRFVISSCENRFQNVFICRPRARPLITIKHFESDNEHIIAGLSAARDRRMKPVKIRK